MARRGPTRKQRIENVIAMIEHGPAFNAGFAVRKGDSLTPDQALKVYRLWAQTWVVDELRELLRSRRNPAESLVIGQCGECYGINKHEPSCSKAHPDAAINAMTD